MFSRVTEAEDVAIYQHDDRILSLPSCRVINENLRSKVLEFGVVSGQKDNRGLNRTERSNIIRHYVYDW